MSVPAFGFLSIWTWLNLNQLESGADEPVSLWAPIAFLYDVGGYWLALLATPFAGIFCVYVFIKKITAAGNDGQP